MSEITPFQEWSPSSGPIVDPIEKRKQYSNYLRGEYLKNKEYSLELDQTIDESTVRALVEVEGPVIEARAAALDIPVQEEFEKILSPSPITFEDKLQIVGMVLGSGYLSTEGDESSALYEFTNFVDDGLEDTATRKQAKREAAESFVNKYYNKKLFVSCVPYRSPDGTKS